MVSESIEKLIAACRKTPKRILVIGDGMTDIYVYGRMESCQDECYKFVETKCRVSCPGGAANASNSLRYWQNVEFSCLSDIHLGLTRIRFISDGKCILRHDNDEVRRPYPEEFAAIREEAMRKIKTWEPHAILISDYDKGLMPWEFIHSVIEICNHQKIPCIADAKRGPGVYRGAIIKANNAWGARNTGDWLVGAKYVETNGCDPPNVWQNSGWVFDCNLAESHPVKCVNHVGAGDCFAAHLTLALAYDFTLADAALIAHEAGRVYTNYLHNAPPQPIEILDLSQKGEK